MTNQQHQLIIEVLNKEYELDFKFSTRNEEIIIFHSRDDNHRDFYILINEYHGTISIEINQPNDYAAYAITDGVPLHLAAEVYEIISE